MASTPVKTSQVDRLGMSFAGTSANADATKLKGRASPEAVRRFESLLDTSNRAPAAEKPAPKPTARSTSRADATPAPRADVEPRAESKPESIPSPKSEDTSKAQSTETAETANIAEVDAAALPEAAPTAPVATAPETDETSESGDAIGAVPPNADGNAEASQSDVQAVPAVVLPVVPEEAATPPAVPTVRAGSVQPVPAEVDLSQQEPVTLPPAPADDGQLALPVAMTDGEAAPLLQGQAATAAAADALASAPRSANAPIPPVAVPPTGTPATGTPATGPLAAGTPTVPSPVGPSSAPDDAAIIEALTVVAPETAEADAEAETALAQRAAHAGTDARSQATPAAQTATVASVVAPVVTDAQPKAKAAPTTAPQAEPVAQSEGDGLAGTVETAPVDEPETQQEQSRQDQSPMERGRERAQERAQAGERLAARFADSQVSLIRDEASLAGPVQTLKEALKPTTAEALLSTSLSPQADAPKGLTLPSATATAVGGLTGMSSSTLAAKTAPRANAPFVQTPIVQQIGTRLIETAVNGGGRVIMELRPEHLGRVTIDVDVRENGRVMANVLVDNPATLEQLRRDAGQLEQALRDAGLNPEQNSLNFALREQAHEKGGFGRDGRGRRDANGDLLADAESVPDVAAPTKQGVVPGLGVIDIRI